MLFTIDLGALMINPQCFQKEWILGLRQNKFTKTAFQLIEKSIYAFELLGLLAQSGKDFVFKGGTSLLLLVPVYRNDILNLHTYLFPARKNRFYLMY